MEELVLLALGLTTAALLLFLCVYYQTRVCVTNQSRRYRDSYESVSTTRTRDEGALLLPISG